MSNNTSKPRRVVLKFGSGILTRLDKAQPDPVQLRKLVEAIALIKANGNQCVVVSSGAVASGLGPLGFDERPSDMTTLQACAALGQTRLMHAYESLLRDHDLHVAQLLLTHEDLETPERAARVRSTLERLLEFPQVVPVINENDSVAIEELRFGDNDKLSSRVARLWGADLLILLTSVPGLLENPEDSNAKPIPVVNNIDEVLHHAQEVKGRLSVGGMISKLNAVKDAVDAGVECVIASGRHAEQLPEVVSGSGVCTRFPAISS
ncbi:MAG: glutamate 5-kinase [Verrucomicrobiaceae bacterium]|nr:glutamate 5-kinase [Verrucomicrobiaceae bacterium]